jgi:hypothetical protein
MLGYWKTWSFLYLYTSMQGLSSIGPTQLHSEVFSKLAGANPDKMKSISCIHKDIEILCNYFVILRRDIPRPKGRHKFHLNLNSKNICI